MKNLPSALMLIAFVYFNYTYPKFFWGSLLLIIGAILMWEYPAKEGLELVRTQIEELRARMENIRWATELSKTQVKVNLATLVNLKNMRER